MVLPHCTRDQNRTGTVHIYFEGAGVAYGSYNISVIRLTVHGKLLECHSELPRSLQF